VQCLLYPPPVFLNRVHVRACRRVRHQYNPMFGTPLGAVVGGAFMAIRAQLKAGEGGFGLQKPLKYPGYEV
jgi:hypothetical protein